MVSDLKQMELHKAVPLYLTLVLLNLKSLLWSENDDSPSNDQILVEMIQAVGKTLNSVIHKPINDICTMEDLPLQ
jgi:hypothetical protein